ncbi:MAG TPA: helix-turn-helix transcriptional regulator [Magnetospirillaceae bacterium]|jgi:DNA-binding transcriptional ArsR family regulator
MVKPLYQPNTDQITLPGVLDALSDPVRLDIVLQLDADGEARCSAMGEHGSKTNLSYHFARLREAGVTKTRIEGASRLIALRREDLEAKFPGLLDTVIANAKGAKSKAA